MERKEMIKLLEEHFEVKAKYMGAPSFAYQIITSEETYIINREGMIKNSEGETIEFEKLLNGEADTDKIETGSTIDAVEVILPMEGHTGITLKNLINMISSKQSLIKKSFKLEEEIFLEDFVKGINDRRIVTIEDFKKAVFETGIEKHQGITFDFEKQTITFRFYRGEIDNDRITTYTQFVTILNESAKVAKHTSFKQTKTDNEKYTFRTWLLRLGIIGDEYKVARKVLLANLDGNGAFRSGKPKKVETGKEEGMGNE